MASPSPFLFLKQRIQYWGQSNDSDPNILRVEITLRGLMSFIHVLATFELNERQYKKCVLVVYIRQHWVIISAYFISHSRICDGLR